MNEEIKRLENEINRLADEGRYNEIYPLACELKQCSKTADYYIGLCYFSGWGVEQDDRKALQCFERSIANNCKEADCWCFGASCLSNLEDYPQSAKWAMMADRKGNKDAALIAGTAFSMADDTKNAVIWLKKAANYGDSYACLLLASVYLSAEDYEKAAEWAQKAETAGENGAIVMLASIDYSLAMDLRSYAAKQLKMDVYAKYNSYAVRHMLDAQNKFYKAIEKEPETMLFSYWYMLGRVGEMLYNLACRGELSVSEDNSVRSYLSNSIKMSAAAMDNSHHKKWWNNAMEICALMDINNAEIVGEYFRVAGCLIDADRHHSAEAYYRAQWHLKRIVELRSCPDKYDMDDLVFLIQNMSDVDDENERLGRKYGSAVQGMMRRGQLPDLTLDYPEGKAPNAMSCKKFREMLENSQTAASHNGAVPQNATFAKKLFGIFGKRG